MLKPLFRSRSWTSRLLAAFGIGALAASALLPSSQASALTWVDWDYGYYNRPPSNAFIGGNFYPNRYFYNYERDYTLRPFFVCRIGFGDNNRWNYGWAYENGCHIGLSGREYTYPRYNWLTGVISHRWGWPRTGLLPWYPWSDSMLSATTEATLTANETALPICRAKVNEDVFVGRVEGSNCHVGYKGIEVIESEFEVLYVQQ